MRWSNWIGEGQKKVRQVSLYISAGTICVPPITFGPKKVWSDGPADKLTIVEISLHTLKADWMRVKERYIALFVSAIFMAAPSKTAQPTKSYWCHPGRQGLKAVPLLLAGWFFSHGDCVMFLGWRPGLAWWLWHCASDQSVSSCVWGPSTNPPSGPFCLLVSLGDQRWC